MEAEDSDFSTRASASTSEPLPNDPSAEESRDPEIIANWTRIQDELRHQVIREDTEAWQGDLAKLTLVAGLDISYPKDAHSQSSCVAFTAVVICSFPELKIIYEETQEVKLDTPYVPGFLAFKESPALITLLEKVIREKPELKPDVIFVDGNGILHPQQCGLACHIGLRMNIPTIGVAKNLFHLDGIKTEKNILQSLSKAGDFMYVRDKASEIIGMALKSRDEATNPIYVSIGHKISLESARQVVLAASKFRVPEPIRFADYLSREFIRKKETPKTTKKQGKSK